MAKNNRKITPLKELPLSHDFMFGTVMSQEKVGKLFLEALLGIKIARIEYIDRQKDLPAAYLYHGIRLDVYLEDDEGTVYNIEMQNTNKGGLPRRARYYQSGIDRRLLEAGESYDELSESYVIFVCNYDPFGGGLAVYERTSSFKDAPGMAYDDGTHVLILNSEYKTGNADGQMLEYLQYLGTDNGEMVPQNELLETVMDAVQIARNDALVEVNYMTYMMKLAEAQKEAKAEGLSEGIEKGIIKATADAVTALMESMSCSFVNACDTLKVSHDLRLQVEKLIKQTSHGA